MTRARLQVRALRRLAIFALATGAAAACDPLGPLKAIDDVQTIVLIEVAPESTSVVVGDTLRFAATVKGLGGKLITERQVIWSPGNPAVASVSDSGLVTARSVGRSEILATVENVRASAILVVKAPPPPPPPPATP